MAMLFVVNSASVPLAGDAAWTGSLADAFAAKCE
jgi:hypothetical protein